MSPFPLTSILQLLPVPSNALLKPQSQFLPHGVTSPSWEAGASLKAWETLP